MTKDKGSVVLVAKVSQPVPAKDLFHPDDKVVQIGEDQLEKQLPIGIDVPVRPGFALLIDDANVPFTSMQIDAAVIVVLLYVKAHGLASFG